MKSILSLGIFFLVLISFQIYLERLNILAPEGTDTELDSLNSHYKIENGKLYFLSSDGRWIDQDNFVWKGENGHYYLQQNGQIYESNNGSYWSLLSTDKMPQDFLPSEVLSKQ
ncbi:MAG TPA: hypothetical protein DIW47_10415 [Bacteroidetes bacterium]|nr:hypothetical protein [Bacteroidota bacterium]